MGALAREAQRVGASDALTASGDDRHRVLQSHRIPSDTQIDSSSQQLGITDEQLEAYAPLAETIGVTFTMLYYVRRSYEEGLAVFGFAGERLAAKSGYAKVMYEGLKKHYGIEVRNFAVHACGAACGSFYRGGREGQRKHDPSGPLRGGSDKGRSPRGVG